ncbi:MAG: acylneuraminate cytidylyltransferase family protein [Planctomycetes bacterium]|nr:acylneuraminate cytidylyltransferase family protein [Planctomycetota bacterium]
MILAVVTARGGSKRLPGKNLRPLGGRPLLWYSIRAARLARLVHRVVVSTEDASIAEAARACGAEVIPRPASLALDESRSVDAVRHACLAVEAAGERPRAVVLLQPTCPLRSPGFIDAGVGALLASDADSAVSVSEERLKLGEVVDGIYRPFYPEGERKQDLPRRWRENGVLYVTRRDVVVGRGSLFGDRILPLPTEPLMAMANIDYELDFQVAEDLYLRHRARLGLEPAPEPIPMEAGVAWTR